jgi:hypothetical protein
MPAQAGVDQIVVALLRNLLAKAHLGTTATVTATESLLARGQDDLAKGYLPALAQPHLTADDDVVPHLDRTLQREADALPRMGGELLPARAAGPRAWHTERAAFALETTPEQAPMLRALTDARSTVSWIDLVPVAVKRFGAEFERGFRDPKAALAVLRGSHDDVLDQWWVVPRERRVFVIGSGADAAEAQRLQTRLERDGYAVFFYDFCRRGGRPLCPSRSVGAFFASSGQTVVLESAQAAGSGFVQLEVAVAQRLRGQRPPFLVLSTADLLDAGARGVQAMALGGWSRTAIVADTGGRSERDRPPEAVAPR